MADDDRILVLLTQWETLRSQGKLLTPEELCPEDPSLWEPLRPQLAQRLRLSLFPELPASADPDVWPGHLPRIPGYEVLEVLGQGGMGIVYKARQVQLNRLVALKMMLGEALPLERARFRTEAEAVARLQHPHIVQIYEVGEYEGRPYLVREWVPGGSLGQHLDGTPLAAQTAATLLLPLAQAVAYAHARSVVHRDLKPDNVLLASVGYQPTGAPQPANSHPLLAGSVPKIADFGLAKQLDVAQGHTKTGEVFGTPCYMAPEQALGRTGEVGPATDVYALVICAPSSGSK